LTIGILLFDDVELLDFAGPYEVFSSANHFIEQNPVHIITFSAHSTIVCTVNGLKVIADVLMADVKKIDCFIIPGGDGSKAVLKDTGQMQSIAAICNEAQMIMSVCSGARIIANLGLLNNKPYTSHHLVMDELAQTITNGIQHPQARYVEHDNIITAAGVSAGIDASLRLLEKFYGRTIAEKTAAYIEYPYSDISKSR
jgi:transcriptional regulator GlxA family with amidase domain